MTERNIRMSISCPISSHITGCFYRNAHRDKAIRHIRALCQDAKKICLYDQYLNACKDVLKLILPNKKVELVYQSKHLNDSAVADLQKYNPQWSFSLDDSLLTQRDRYIVIDNKMEIILSSGFMYLELTGKYLTYVVRPVQENWLLVIGCRILRIIGIYRIIFFRVYRNISIFAPPLIRNQILSK